MKAGLELFTSKPLMYGGAPEDERGKSEMKPFSHTLGGVSAH